VWDVACQRGSPVDDDIAGLTEGCESRSCQRMEMMTRKIERKKGRCVCAKRGYHLWRPLWKPTLSAAMSKSLRLSLPDCDRYPRLQSMPQIVLVLDTFSAYCNHLHGHVGGVLVGVIGLWWWRLAAAEVVGG